MRTGWLVRRGLKMAGRRLLSEAHPEPDALRGRMRVDPDWRRLGEDGAAARLPPTRTIEVTRKRRWKAHDPLEVQAGWWAPWQAAGLAMWGTVVGVSWWLGSRHGRGPLKALHEPWEPWFPQFDDGPPDT
jgi:hypothetical protein